MREAPIALLATELGGGRGHVSTLIQTGLALGAEVKLIAALGEMLHAGEMRRIGIEVFQCPKLSAPPELKATPLRRGNATWPCYLADCGFMDRDILLKSLTFWRQLLLAQRVRILIADYAPLALRAALALRDEGHPIRIITVGTGYGIPPRGLAPLPHLTPGYTRVIHPEAAVLASLNAAGEALGMAPLPQLSALYDVDLALVGTFAFLDPYQRPAKDLVPPIVSRSDDLARGEEVFVYFSRDEIEDTALAEALCRLPLPKRGFFPAASAKAKARLAASGIVVEEKPMLLNEMARRSKLMIHPAPHGSICMAALAGLPQIGLPGHREQVTHAKRAEAAGILTVLPPQRSSADEILAGIEVAYHDPGALGRAHDLAMRLRQDFPTDPMEDLRQRLAPQVKAALG